MQAVVQSFHLHEYNKTSDKIKITLLFDVATGVNGETTSFQEELPVFEQVHLC